MIIKRLSLFIIILLCFSIQSFTQDVDSSARPSWKSINSVGPKPSARYGHSMVFITKRGTVLMFGGIDALGNYLGDTWEWNGTTRRWTLLSTDGPRARAFHAMAYDSGRNVVVLQGGEHDDGDYSPSTWEWVGTKWIYVKGGGPDKRAGHKMVYDVARKQIVLFGGFRNYGTTWESFDETWIWENLDWTKVNVSNPPRYRHSHAMVYDANNSRVLMQGGQHSLEGVSDDGSLSSHIFEWNGSDWRMISSGGPRYRRDHELFVEPGSGDVLAFGGVDEYGSFSPAFWKFTSNHWKWLSGVVPPGRQSYGVASDTKTNVVWLWGGITSTGELDARMWYYSGSTPFDLIMSRLKAKPGGPYVAGENIILVLRLKNNSDSDSEDYSIEIYLSLDKEIDSFDARMLDLTVTTPIKAHKRKKINLLSEIPVDAVPDDYWLIAKLTSAKEESNADNNIYISKKRITIE